MKNIRKWLGGLVLVGAVLLVAITPGWAEDDTGSLDITIMNMDFKLDDASLKGQVLMLPIGMGLSFMNVDPLITASGLEGLMPHFVFINDPDGKEIARSVLMNKQEQSTFSHKFTQPGLYTYGCLIHPFMRGKALVFQVQTAEQSGVR